MIVAETIMLSLIVIGTAFLALVSVSEGGTKKACGDLKQAKSNGDGFYLKEAA